MFWPYLGLSFLAGIILGAFFFGGLWWTVQKITGGGNPYLITIVSFIIRTVVILGAFYLLVRADWSYLLAALVGFIIARTYLSYKLKPYKKK